MHINKIYALMPKIRPKLRIMPKHTEDKRRTGKDKRRKTFNKYGKNTTRGLRHIAAALIAHKNKTLHKKLKSRQLAKSIAIHPEN